MNRKVSVAASMIVLAVTGKGDRSLRGAISVEKR